MVDKEVNAFLNGLEVLRRLKLYGIYGCTIQLSEDGSGILWLQSPYTESSFNKAKEILGNKLELEFILMGVTPGIRFYNSLLEFEV